MTIISDINYFKIVTETLAEKGSEYRHPLHIDEADLTAGITLFTKIAVEAINKGEALQESISATREVYLDPSSSEGTIAKIKAFVTNKAYNFRKACQTGFPFSLVESHFTERALKQALEQCDSLLYHVMMVEDHWMDESELDERFGRPFQRLQLSEIIEACFDLTRAYVKDNDSKAGYYLLWLIKQATGCVYEIPEKSSCNNQTVAKVLSEFFIGLGFVRNSANFVEIFHSRSSKGDQFLYQEFLDQQSCLIFLNFAVQQLVEIPMDRWPRKAYIIINLLQTVLHEGKLDIARALILSKDPITLEVGSHLLAALTVLSLREAVPHFTALIERLPNCTYVDIENIFGYPFIKFCHERFIYKKDPGFTRRLHFNDMRQVFVHGSIMMGVYDTRTISGGKRAPPWLLAYDMNTEKMVWGICVKPISLENPSVNISEAPVMFGIPRRGPSGYSLNRVGEWLSLQLVGEKTVYFIHPETGEYDSTLELPEVFKNAYDCLHISQNGFGYQMVRKDGEKILIGGKIVDKRWHSSFEVTLSNNFGSFRSLSTHCGFQQPLQARKLVLFGPTGDQVTIEDCMAVEAHGNTLYSIEKDPVDKDQRLLQVRTLQCDNEVVSAVEKSIPLNLKEVSFGKICQNGQVILFTGRGIETSPVFVNLNSQEIIYSQHKIPTDAERFVNADSGELWTWDELSEKIWKVSSSNSTLMGSMKSGRGTTLVHVDKADRLYFVDIPF